MPSLSSFVVLLSLICFASMCIETNADFYNEDTVSTPVDMNLSIAEENRIFDGYSLDGSKGEIEPRVVFVLAIPKSGKKSACVGSLLSRDAVVTAAHCLLNNKFPKRQVSKITVTVDSNYWNNSDGKGQIIEVDQTYFHHFFSTFSYTYDVAVLRLKENVRNPDTRMYMKLGSNRPVDFGMDGRATTFGWGEYYKGSNISHTLRYGDRLDILPPVQCKDNFNTPENWWTGRYRYRDHHYCAKTSDNRNICSGDSGAPMIFQGELVGIASSAHGVCDLEGLSLWTKVSAVWDFINRKAGLRLKKHKGY